MHDLEDTAEIQSTGIFGNAYDVPRYLPHLHLHTLVITLLTSPHDPLNSTREESGPSCVIIKFTGTQGPQETNDNTGLKKNIDAGQTEEENVSTQQYIVFPLWSSISSSYKSSDEKAKDYTVDDDACKKTVQEPASEYDQALKNVLDKMMDQEKEATEQSDAVRKEFKAQCDSQLLQEKITRASNTNRFNTVSTPDTAEIQSTSIFGNAYDDHDLETLNTPYADQSVGAEADFNNMEPSTVVSPIPTNRVHSIHPKAQIIGDPKLAVQTRGMTKKNSGEHAIISYIQKQKRTNHKDF
ncbi:hypothetical protein Tco_0965590 [Tanacetum coccineum]